MSSHMTDTKYETTNLETIWHIEHKPSCPFLSFKKSRIGFFFPKKLGIFGLVVAFEHTYCMYIRRNEGSMKLYSILSRERFWYSGFFVRRVLIHCPSRITATGCKDGGRNGTFLTLHTTDNVWRELVSSYVHTVLRKKSQDQQTESGDCFCVLSNCIVRRLPDQTIFRACTLRAILVRHVLIRICLDHCPSQIESR